MPKDIYIFKRYEKKYPVSIKQKEALLSAVSSYIVPDSHGHSTISSLYLDTPDYLLIRNSIEAKAYKEKLRIRAYGVPGKEDKVFFEIKKKFQGVVYKRRVSMPLHEAEQYLQTGVKPTDSQIMREIDYTMDFYGRPQPAMLISYEREAFYGKDCPGLRLTFDTNVRYKEHVSSLSQRNDGECILSPGQFILEVKTEGAMPLWLSHALNQLEIYPASFSKYGRAYREMIYKGEYQNVSNF